MNEREIIEWFQQGAATDNIRGLVRGIGDDCAVIAKDANQSWLVTMDTLVEGVHFDLRWHPPEKLGRKSVAVNISDIAAMGGEPLFIFLSLGLPKGFDPSWLQSFSNGISEACKENKCFLAGGDTVRSMEGILITITVIGEAPADQVVYRNNAAVGDAIWVSGSLGMAAAGLALCKKECDHDISQLNNLVEAHLNPIPRVRLGRLLAENKIVHAMMDLSDGLATDLSQLCKESGVGAVINAEKLPVDPALKEVSQQIDKEPLDLALRGGEDYELLFTAVPEAEKEIKALGVRAGVPLSQVGTIVEKPGVRLNMSTSFNKVEDEIDISFEGFDHFSER